MDRRIWTATHTLAVVLLLASGVLLVYAQVLRHPFTHYDDRSYITDNPRVTDGLSLGGIGWAFTTRHASNYWHPLTWVSHMLDAELFGTERWRASRHERPAARCSSALILFFALRRLTRAPRAERPYRLPLCAAPAPRRIGRVGCRAEGRPQRALLRRRARGLGVVRGAARRPAATPRRPFSSRSGCSSKPMLVTFPFVLLLLDVWPLRRLTDVRRAWPLVLEKAPMFVVSTAVGAVTIAIQPAGAMAGLDVLPLGARIGNALLAYAGYLGKTFRPAGLSVFYPHDLHPSAARVTLTLALLALVTGLAWTLRARRPYLLVGWLWFLGMLVPTLGLVQVGAQAMADRYTYLPLIGVFIALAWTTHELAADSAGARRVWAAGWVLAVLVLVLLARRQVSFWSSDERLYTHAIEVTGENYLAELALGNDRYDRRDWSGAAARYETVVRLKPDYVLALYNLAMARLQEGRSDEAAARFAQVLRLDPGRADAETNLCLALQRLKRHFEASAHCARAVALDGRSASALNQLAWIRATSPDAALRSGAEAVRLAEAAIALAGEHNHSYLDTLGAAYAEAGRFPEAVRTARLALQLAGDAQDAPAAQAYASRLARYESGRPHREP